jgi:hypothetical protein
LEFSYHSLILLVGFAVAGLALFAAIAVGPYGRRGVRVTLAMLSFIALLGSVGFLMFYLGWIDQRRAIETRLAELRAQALSAGSTLACLERTGEMVEGACAQALFAAPETLAAANVYTSTRLDMLMAAARYAGPRSAQFDDAIMAVRRSLQQDPFGLTANILMRREGCTAERCEALALFSDPTRLMDNIRQKVFDAHVARHAANWRAPGAPAPAATTAAPATAPMSGETRAPIPDKYTLPSSASIPPVSIMNEEPARPPAPPPARERVTAPASAAPAAAPEQLAAPPAVAAQPTAPPAAAPRQQRRETRPSAPLSITPKQ